MGGTVIRSTTQIDSVFDGINSLDDEQAEAMNRRKTLEVCPRHELPTLAGFLSSTFLQHVEPYVCKSHCSGVVVSVFYLDVIYSVVTPSLVVLDC